MKNLRIPTLAAMAGLLAVTACTDVNTATTNPNQRRDEGTAIGAASGALLGLLGGKDVRERRNAALVGAVLGGAIGRATGAKLDQQAAELQADIGDGRVQIINNGDSLTVRMPQDILFAVDSTAVNASLRSDLAAVAANLNKYPGSTVAVIGHTDNTGSAAYNMDLSARRASAVANILIANGVAPGRIQAIGRGEDAPIASNLTAAGRAQNRRVDIVIRPNA